jgi:hypothetical protein
MGQSMAPVADTARAARGLAAGPIAFEQFGLHFEVLRQGDRVIHREQSRDSRGHPLATLEAEVEYVLGSGTRGRSYLVNRDGYLFQSPISWFAQKGTWDISPGYSPDQHFDRAIQVQCLFCHANDADPVEGTVNRYCVPLFRAAAIGCERCHGPGDLHVRRREQGDDPAGLDDTIVNPGRLEPALREAVCEQCHLQGEKRVLRRGRGPFDYRPGLPLHLFWSVFVRVPDLTEENQAVGQVEQMRVSRCSRASGGRLGCISCHDPHELPAADRKAAYYRGRCLNCHAEHDCGLPATVRQDKNHDACSACHMPRLTSSDIAHTAVTDHRIRRRPAPTDTGEAESSPLEPGANPLVSFYKAVADPRDREVSRDMGLALMELAREHGPAAQPLGAIALPYLEGAVHRAPDDVPAWEARGYALGLEEHGPEALDSVEAALARAPTREQALTDAAVLAGALKRYDAAAAYWRRALAVNPWATSYHEQLAQLLAVRGDWPAATAECLAALRLNPLRAPARLLLIRCHLHGGRQDEARAELDTLLAMQPSEAEALRRWFREQKP